MIPAGQKKSHRMRVRRHSAPTPHCSATPSGGMKRVMRRMRRSVQVEDLECSCSMRGRAWWSRGWCKVERLACSAMRVGWVLVCRSFDCEEFCARMLRRQKRRMDAGVHRTC